MTVVTGSLASSLVVPVSPSRFALMFENNTTTAVLVGFVSASSAGSTVTPARYNKRIASGSNWEPSKPYYGPVSVVWDVIPTTGSLIITEMF